MSEILSDEIVEVIKAKRTKLVGIKCDCCEKMIPVKTGYHKENEYYEVTTGHHEWGNDSVDSIDNYDICPDCIGKFVTKYLNETMRDTAYIDIERVHAWPENRWV